MTDTEQLRNGKKTYPENATKLATVRCKRIKQNKGTDNTT